METVSIIWIPFSIQRVSISWILYPDPGIFHFDSFTKHEGTNGNRFHYLDTVSNCFLTVSKRWKHLMKQRVYPKGINVRVLTGGLRCALSLTF